jgi:signal transduction histidine kinase
VRLYARIYLHLLVVLLVVGAASPFIFAVGWRVALLRTWTLRLANHTANLIAVEPAERRIDAVKRLSEELDLEMTFRAPDGRVLAAYGDPMAPMSSKDLAEAREGARTVHRGHAWYVVAPVYDNNRTLVGYLQLFPMRRFMAGHFWLPLGRVLLLLAAVALATFPLARRITRPIEKLTEASRRLGRGELSYRISPGHDRDQLGQLVASWNEMAAELERLVSGQRELLANVSHELRSPLTRIRVALELLPSDEATRLRSADMRSDLDELDHLIEDVLTNARLGAADFALHKSAIDVGELFAELRARAGEHPLTVGKELQVLEPNVPPIVGDRTLLKRALWNLIENAAKYGKPPIRLSLRTEHDKMLFAVSDAGSGIAPDDRERVFDPFFRLDPARTPDGRGYGLGLTLVRKVAQLHGGRAYVRDNNGACEFTIEIPN